MNTSTRKEDKKKKWTKAREHRECVVLVRDRRLFYLLFSGPSLTICWELDRERSSENVELTIWPISEKRSPPAGSSQQSVCWTIKWICFFILFYCCTIRIQIKHNWAINIFVSRGPQKLDSRASLRIRARIGSREPEQPVQQSSRCSSWKYSYLSFKTKGN